MTTTDPHPVPGLTKRQSRSEQRKESHWSDRMAAARSPHARAEVAWDRIRSDIYALPEDQQAAAWKLVEQALEDVRAKVAEIAAEAKAAAAEAREAERQQRRTSGRRWF